MLRAGEQLQICFHAIRIEPENEMINYYNFITILIRMRVP